jgi:uncharacterized LabA/DUF88 family protein
MRRRAGSKGRCYAAGSALCSTGLRHISKLDIGTYSVIDETLIFVDGENLTLRYQEMVRAGRVPAPDNVHIRDCFVWNQRVLDDNLWNLKRVSYYTSVTGSDDLVRQVREQIAAVKFNCRTGAISGALGTGFTTRTGQIVPFVRRKSARTRKESVCDIAITVDVMRACYRDHAKIIWLFSGDGDFLSLLNEVVHNGKSAYVAALSSGLSEEIHFAVDEFTLLDKYFFLPQATTTAQAQAPAQSPLEAPTGTGAESPPAEAAPNV